MMKVTQNFLAIIICSNVIPNPGLWSTVVSCFWNNLSQYFSLPCVFDFQQDKKGYFHIAKRSFPDLRIEDVWLCLQDFSRVSALLSIVQLRVASPPPGRPRLGVGSMDRRREDSAYFSRTAFLFFFSKITTTKWKCGTRHCPDLLNFHCRFHLCCLWTCLAEFGFFPFL